MKHLLAAASIAFIAGLLQSPTPTYSQQVAVAGCCKQNGVNNGKSFDDCVAENAVIDGDDPYKNEGTLWWDVNC